MAVTASLPKHFTPWPDLILAGFSGAINYTVAERIRHSTRFSEFAAWGVSGKIWWDEKNKNWCAEIWKKTILLATINEEVIEDLAYTIQKHFGWK